MCCAVLCCALVYVYICMCDCREGSGSEDDGYDESEGIGVLIERSEVQGTGGGPPPHSAAEFSRITCAVYITKGAESIEQLNALKVCTDQYFYPLQQLLIERCVLFICWLVWFVDSLQSVQTAAKSYALKHLTLK